MRNAWSAVLLALTFAAAGCMDGQDEDREADERREAADVSAATIGFDGSGSPGGTDVLTCARGAGQLNGFGAIDAGDVTVTIRDGAGQQVFRGTYNDALDFEGEVVEGVGGDWTIETDGAGDLDGYYVFTVMCS